MTPADFIDKRSGDWKQLDRLIRDLDYRRDRGTEVRDMLHFARLYRSACTDLSLARAYRLPADMQRYLEDLVSRGHSNLYNFRGSRMRDVKEFFLRKIPYLVYTDRYVRICQLAFFVPLFACGYMAFRSPKFADQVVGQARLQKMEEMHSRSGIDRAREGKQQTASGAALGTGFYVYNNVSIDLMVFGLGILGGVGSLFLTVFNGVYIGAILGHLIASPVRDNILLWITPHGPFELVAIGISAGAGLRIGFAFIAPGGRRRLRALQEEARHAIPVITAAALLTGVAAFIEAIVAPSALTMPYRLAVAISCTVFMIAYFGVGGFILKRDGYEPTARKQIDEALLHGEQSTGTDSA